jgi:predicted aminopeptidase
MDLLKIIFLSCFLVLTSAGCQVGYLIKSGYNQLEMLSQRVPIDEALKDPSLSEEDKRKLLLAQKAHVFAEQDLHLKATRNYTSFVKLNRPYVTYVVSAAPRWELKHYLFSYPFVGKMPYKGFFNEQDAKELQQDLNKENLDTYMRGVSAYSTLGWFKDPILSSMLRYKDSDLVNTIIHETVHATLYIKHEADFNERMAVFSGNKGMELFYLKEEGPESPTLAKVRKDNADDKLFSGFISKELNALEQWYKDLPVDDRNEEKRKARIHEIQERFKDEVLPHLQTDSYKKFPEVEMNNARLLVYKTYFQDLSDFEALYKKVNGDFARFIDQCKSLQDEKDPVAALKKLISQ